jgi:hypothetical protein
MNLKSNLLSTVVVFFFSLKFFELIEQIVAAPILIEIFRWDISEFLGDLLNDHDVLWSFVLTLFLSKTFFLLTFRRTFNALRREDQSMEPGGSRLIWKQVKL